MEIQIQMTLSEQLKSKVLRTAYVREDIESGDHSTTAGGSAKAIKS